MKSGKQRRVELKAKAAKKRATLDRANKQAAEIRAARRKAALGGIDVNPGALAPYNSYSGPDFVLRGYYVNEPFECGVCGKQEVWTAAQQKWWYEVAKGSVWSSARLCRPCRRRERERKAEARRSSLGGLAAKRQREAT